MAALVAHRSAESRALADFLNSAAVEPSVLVIEGEPGIGKTTLWLAAIEEGRRRGFQVLAARPAAAESVLAYASLADCLADIDPSDQPDLSPAQRMALDRVVLQGDTDGPPTDRRAVCAGFLAVVTTLAEAAPILLAIDDVQWLDSSSAHVIEFVARRLVGRVGMLVSRRTEGVLDGAGWLQSARTECQSRITLGPLSLGALHSLIATRLGFSMPRPTMVRIHQISGGNPFYALELARAMGDAATYAEVALPDTLTELVHARINELDDDVRELLLAAACVAAPTVDLIALATDIDIERTAELLDGAAATGIVALDGRRLRFAHPLLAHGIYTGSSPGQRRTIHRRLAGILEEPELRARQMALSATRGDEPTLEALDAAAESARRRGAPAAAAELIDLAIGLGGDTPARRIRSARHHFSSGDAGRAKDLLEVTIDGLPPGPERAEASSALGLAHFFDDSYRAAAAVLKRALDEAGDNLALRTRLLIRLSYARYNAGQFGAATSIIGDAIRHAERLGEPDPLSQALRMQVLLRFLRGDGFDAKGLERALASADLQADLPMAFRADMQKAMLLSWAGQLDEAHHELVAIRRRCTERGEENELIFAAMHSFLTDVWRGNFTDAAVIGEDTMERALQLGGDVPMGVALTMRATLAVYAGAEDQARDDLGAALAASQRSGANLFVVWPITTLGFLEVSLGNYDATLTAFEPLLTRFAMAPGATEIIVAWFIPHAVEAMVGLGRLDDAEPLVDALERNGRRLDRAWMLAVGARCRSMLLAARGDLEAASAAAERAMAEHQRLPMPFEQARTQLLLGQLQRRQRLKDTAAQTLSHAVAAFEEMGIVLWEQRTRAELGRAKVSRGQGSVLTPTELRVAALAARGMRNRDIAAELFISPRTVEVNMTRVYRKLGIRSRAELGRVLDEING